MPAFAGAVAGLLPALLLAPDRCRASTRCLGLPARRAAGQERPETLLTLLRCVMLPSAPPAHTVSPVALALPVSPSASLSRCTPLLRREGLRASSETAAVCCMATLEAMLRLRWTLGLAAGLPGRGVCCKLAVCLPLGEPGLLWLGDPGLLVPWTSEAVDCRRVEWLLLRLVLLGLGMSVGCWHRR